LTWSIFHKLRSDPGYRQWADVASQLFGGLDILTELGAGFLWSSFSFVFEGDI
jgi:hypothetical protein